MGRDFQQFADDCMVCTDFAAEYKQENPNAVIKYGTVESQHGTEEEHAWVYDPQDDATKDATLGQFIGIPEAEDDVFPGDEHPLANEQAEFDTLEEFAKGPGGNYLLE